MFPASSRPLLLVHSLQDVSFPSPYIVRRNPAVLVTVELSP